MKTIVDAHAVGQEFEKNQVQLSQPQQSASLQNTESMGFSNAVSSQSPIKSTELGDANGEIEIIGHYDKKFKFLIFIYLLSDFYCRLMPTVLIFLINSMNINITGEDDEIGGGIIVAVIMMTSLIIFESFSLKWMRKDEYKKWNDIVEHILVSLFSSVINLLLTLPLRQFIQKNQIERFLVQNVVRLIINIIWTVIVVILYIETLSDIENSNQSIIDTPIEILFWLFAVCSVVCFVCVVQLYKYLFWIDEDIKPNFVSFCALIVDTVKSHLN